MDLVDDDVGDQVQVGVALQAAEEDPGGAEQQAGVPRAGLGLHADLERRKHKFSRIAILFCGKWLKLHDRRTFVT